MSKQTKVVFVTEWNSLVRNQRMLRAQVADLIRDVQSLCKLFEISPEDLEDDE